MDDKDLAEMRELMEQERVEQEKVVIAQEEKNKETMKAMEVTLQSLRDAKPSERNEMARRYAVAITEYEKSLAFFKFYVVDQA